MKKIKNVSFFLAKFYQGISYCRPAVALGDKNPFLFFSFICPTLYLSHSIRMHTLFFHFTKLGLQIKLQILLKNLEHSITFDTNNQNISVIAF